MERRHSSFCATRTRILIWCYKTSICPVRCGLPPTIPRICRGPPAHDLVVEIAVCDGCRYGRLQIIGASGAGDGSPSHQLVPSIALVSHVSPSCLQLPEFMLAEPLQIQCDLHLLRCSDVIQRRDQCCASRSHTRGCGLPYQTCACGRVEECMAACCQEKERQGETISAVHECF